MQDADAKTKRLPVMEIFGPTIQGEGVVAGLQTYFIRFGLCDFKCTRCDSIHAIDPKYVNANASRMTIDEIVNRVTHMSGHARWVTLSGGNPAIHDLTELVSKLHAHGFGVAVETQGTKAPSWLNTVDILTCSPKPPGMGVEIDRVELMNFIHTFHKHPGFNIKIPVFSAVDLEFARQLYFTLHDKYGSSLDDSLYLSLGNPWPPELPGAMDPTEPPSSPDYTQLVMSLIGLYKQLYDEIKSEPALAHYKFLPQLHVLLWGNLKGV